MKQINRLLAFLALFLASLSFPTQAYAICPVCTIAVGAGLGLSRFLGIDDSVSGVWLGGFIVSISFWTSTWLLKKSEKLHAAREILPFAITFLTYLITIIPLWQFEIIGHPFNTILGIDKLVFGMATGSLLFLTALFFDKKVRQIKGRQLFNFQKVVFPILSMIIGSIVLFILTSLKMKFI